MRSPVIVPTKGLIEPSRPGQCSGDRAMSAADVTTAGRAAHCRPGNSVGGIVHARHADLSVLMPPAPTERVAMSAILMAHVELV